MSDSIRLEAILRSREAPSEEQRRRLVQFLFQKYQQAVSLTWQRDESIGNGFLLEVGQDVYDWTVSGRYRQLKMQIEESPGFHNQSVISLLRENLAHFEPSAAPEEAGSVLRVGDGIARVSGLREAFYGEILLFESGLKGMVMDLQKDSLGCILFGDESEIKSGSRVYRTKKEAGIPVGETMLGRVINALGAPIDGKGNIITSLQRPLENPAPAIIDRESVNAPLETGILAIDAMFPIGKGQRELIIGDRQTGKTTIALDTILNQKDKNVICIYAAIGQKNSSVAQLAETLRRYGAMDYSIIVSAGASESAALQYIAPYAATAIGEHFMSRGRDVLIVYDDLSKHAAAYRAMSLLLGRSPGREAYPGDVFYLHSRLLERSGHLSKEKGGGSMSALPIVETQAGDVSAYIPTNIISITDGQLFLESSLFLSGQRPAINVGLSVSRVGGAAQTKALKLAAGSLKLELSQYLEMQVFTQFSSELDDETKKQLSYGQSLMHLIRQAQHKAYEGREEVILLLSAAAGQMEGIPLSKLSRATEDLLHYLERRESGLCQKLQKGEVLAEEDKERLLSLSESFLERYREMPS